MKLSFGITPKRHHNYLNRLLVLNLRRVFMLRDWCPRDFPVWTLWSGVNGGQWTTVSGVIFGSGRVIKKKSQPMLEPKEWLTENSFKSTFIIRATGKRNALWWLFYAFHLSRTSRRLSSLSNCVASGMSLVSTCLRKITSDLLFASFISKKFVGSDTNCQYFSVFSIDQ